MYIYFRKDTRQFSHSSVEKNGGDWLYEFDIPDAKPMHSYLLGDDDTVVEGDPIPHSEVEFDQAEFDMQALRRARDEKLAATDWMAMSDRTMTAEQIAYRQALRDVTKLYRSVADVVWPTLEG